MASQGVVLTIFCIAFVCVMLSFEIGEARYLPTRGSTDKVDKLRELLREVSCFNFYR